MDSYSGCKCWEIMNCDNYDCPARYEPETPCWEIAKRDGLYHKVSKNCSDCLGACRRKTLQGTRYFNLNLLFLLHIFLPYAIFTV